MWPFVVDVDVYPSLGGLVLFRPVSWSNAAHAADESRASPPPQPPTSPGYPGGNFSLPGNTRAARAVAARSDHHRPRISPFYAQLATTDDASAVPAPPREVSDILARSVHAKMRGPSAQSQSLRKPAHTESAMTSLREAATAAPYAATEEKNRARRGPDRTRVRPTAPPSRHAERAEPESPAAEAAPAAPGVPRRSPGHTRTGGGRKPDVFARRRSGAPETHTSSSQKPTRTHTHQLRRKDRPDTARDGAWHIPLGTGRSPGFDAREVVVSGVEIGAGGENSFVCIYLSRRARLRGDDAGRYDAEVVDVEGGGRGWRCRRGGFGVRELF